jgi:hypothetical protein
MTTPANLPYEGRLRQDHGRHLPGAVTSPSAVGRRPPRLFRAYQYQQDAVAENAPD